MSVAEARKPRSRSTAADRLKKIANKRIPAVLSALEALSKSATGRTKPTKEAAAEVLRVLEAQYKIVESVFNSAPAEGADKFSVRSFNAQIALLSLPVLLARLAPTASQKTQILAVLQAELETLTEAFASPEEPEEETGAFKLV